LIANMAEHLKQHITFQYVVLVRMIASEAAGKPIDSFMKQAEEDPQLSAQIDQAIAAAAPRAQQMLMQQLGPMIQPLMGLFAKAAEMKKASQIPHPDAVAAASLVDEATRKTAESAATLDLKEQDQMKKAEQKDRQIALDERKFEVDTAFKAQDAENERQRDALMLEEVRQPGNQVPGI